MRIDQVLVSASYGDAITLEALQIRELLRRAGPSEIYARYIDPKLDDDVLPLARYERRSLRSPTDLVVLHASIGDDDVFAFLNDRRERIALVYHNISPWDGFVQYDPELADRLRSGREQLTHLRDRVVLAVADSAYNANELEALGFPDVPVAPLILDLDGLVVGEPDVDTGRDLAAVDGPLVLFVGQVLPHKRPDLLVAAHHVLATYLRPDAHLALVGAFRLPGYVAAVRTFVHELNLSTVRLTGRVSRDELVAYYRRADLFVTASEHEGFCVPLLEAMAFDVPIVATASAAIPETLDGAGLLVPEGDVLLLAEAVHAVLDDTRLRDDLVARGRERLARYDGDRARQIFLGHLLEVA
jgi:glycosyltransferase involved in cell wall biosynthesis